MTFLNNFEQSYNPIKQTKPKKRNSNTTLINFKNFKNFASNEFEEKKTLSKNLIKESVSEKNETFNKMNNHINNFNFENCIGNSSKKGSLRSSIDGFFSFDMDNFFQNPKKIIDDNEIFNNFCPYIKNEDETDIDTENIIFMSNSFPKVSNKESTFLNRKRNKFEDEEENSKVKYFNFLLKFILNIRKIISKEMKALNYYILILILKIFTLNFYK